MVVLTRENTIDATYGRWEDDGSSPFFPVVERNDAFRVDTSLGRDLMMFGSCDYLGLSQRPELAEASIQAIRDFGTNTYGAQLLIGHTRIHHELEDRLSTLHPDYVGLLFPSGMAANLAVIPALVGKEDVILADRKDHVSIFMGATLSGAEVRTFAHNDMNKLEALLQRTQTKRSRCIIVDGLYSADGDHAPMRVIAELAERYDARIIVDEAHSFAIVGPTGLGVAEHDDALERVDIIVGTMSKALGSTGGFVLTRPEIERTLRYLAPSYTSSRGNAPAVAAASLAAFAVLEREGDTLRDLLARNVQHVLPQLRSRGFNILDTVSHIVPLIVGDETKTVEAAGALIKRGIFTATFLYPHVPAGLGRLRIGLSAAHSTDDCAQLIDALADVRDEVGFA